MTDQQRRRLRRQPSARPVGTPNVLSNQATPNTLSTMGRTGGGIPAAGPSKVATRPVAGSAPLPRPTTGTGRPTLGDERFERPQRRLRRPSLGAIIFFGIILFNAARLFGAGTSGGANPTARPAPTTSGQRTPSPSATYGTVTFGKAHGDGCTLSSTAPSFSSGVAVFWNARLLQPMPATAAVTIVTLKNGRQIDYEYVPPDPSVGPWQVFCAGPVKDELAGTYRIELWNAERSKLLAKGEFVRLGASAAPDPTTTPGVSDTPAPTPTHVASGPKPTLHVALAGAVTFGTAVDAECRLSGMADTFDATDMVWWRAELNQAVPAGLGVRLFTLWDGTIIGNEVVPEAALMSERSTVCAWASTPGVATGAYTIQIWSDDRQVMLANGGFSRRP